MSVVMSYTLSAGACMQFHGTILTEASSSVEDDLPVATENAIIQRVRHAICL